MDTAAAASAADGEGGRSVDSQGVRSKATEQERQRCCSNGAGHTAEMSCSEILCGKGEYRGLVPMIMAYLNLIGTDAHTLERIDKYMDFICARASGELLTPAQWMRRFVRTHPDYKADSVVSERIAADLMQACHRIGKGELRVPELHGHFDVGTVSAKDGYAKPLVSGGGQCATRTNADESHVRANLDRYTERAELQRKRRKLQADIEGLNSAKASKESELASLNSAIADTLGGRSLDP